MSICKNCETEKDGGVHSATGFFCYDEPCWQIFLAESKERTRQEIENLTSQGLCYFTRAWIGRCKKPGTPFCDDHGKQKCSSCGSQATQECSSTGQFVCGAPLCEECEHAIAPDGTNGGVGFYTTVPEDMRATWKSHCKKTEQQFQPWYAREPEAGAHT